MGQAKNRAAQINHLKSNGQKQPLINLLQVQDALQKLTDVLLGRNPMQDYAQSPLMAEAATLLSAKFGKVSDTNFNSLLQYREYFEASLTKQFGIEFVTGPCAFTWDVEVAMKGKGVPQEYRVMSGLLDLVIAKVGINSGAIKFHNA